NRYTAQILGFSGVTPQATRITYLEPGSTASACGRSIREFPGTHMQAGEKPAKRVGPGLLGGRMASSAIIVIGRNEGERLEVCLESARRCTEDIVYVDSGSTDGSVGLAKGLSVQVVELDPALPFSAARARNAGFDHALELSPQIEFVQFVDGDCELDLAWMEAARQAAEDSKVAVVCGRRRERYADSSIYNLLCDMEWATPIGETDSCGGDSFVRVKAFSQVGGFDPAVVAGEEFDLCIRMREEGWRILRIDAEMTLHDANMLRFSQWWTRMVRAGHAYAEGVIRYGVRRHRRIARALRSAVLWGGILPVLSVAILPWAPGVAVGLWVSWILLGVRIYRSDAKREFSSRDRIIYSAGTVLANVPLSLGSALFVVRKLMRRPSALIEYKDSPSV
ncbi:MAG: glycosyltransferase, partial [Myxococcota bacterium]